MPPVGVTGLAVVAGMYPPSSTTLAVSPLGSVPGLKASRMMPRSPGRAYVPVLPLTRTSRMPGGTRNGMAGAPSSAAAMKSRKIGAATEAPVSFLPTNLAGITFVLFKTIRSLALRYSGRRRNTECSMDLSFR